MDLRAARLLSFFLIISALACYSDALFAESKQAQVLVVEFYGVTKNSRKKTDLVSTLSTARISASSLLDVSKQQPTNEFKAAALDNNKSLIKHELRDMCKSAGTDFAVGGVFLVDSNKGVVYIYYFAYDSNKNSYLLDQRVTTESGARLINGCKLVSDELYEAIIESRDDSTPPVAAEKPQKKKKKEKKSATRPRDTYDIISGYSLGANVGSLSFVGSAYEEYERPLFINPYLSYDFAYDDFFTDTPVVSNMSLGLEAMFFRAESNDKDSRLFFRGASPLVEFFARANDSVLLGARGGAGYCIIDEEKAGAGESGLYASGGVFLRIHLSHAIVNFGSSYLQTFTKEGRSFLYSYVGTGVRF